MAFWTDNLEFNEQAGTKDPKRNYRFRVIFPGLDADGSGVIWYAKTVSKPQVTVGETEHKYLGHTYYFPGSVEWSKVTLTLVDPVSPGVTAQMNALLVAAGYKVPGKPDNLETLSKAKAASSIGTVQIIQIDAEGNALETWELNNSFITNLQFGDLDYGNEDLTELTMELRYDWASCTIGPDAASARKESITDGSTTAAIEGGRDFFKTTES